MVTRLGLKGKAAQQRALQIFNDSLRIEPETHAGQVVRSQAMADAYYSTYTNDGGYSKLALNMRAALNTATGDLRVGDNVMPYAKTPANVQGAGADAAGVGMARGAFKLPEAIRQMKEGNTIPMQEVVRDMAHTGLGLSFAVFLAYVFDPEDFTGAYDSLLPKDRQMAGIKNAPFNSIRIGDKWISLDFLGPLAAPFVGIMYARKYGEDLPTSIYQYTRGAGSQLLNFPGLKEVSSLWDSMGQAVKQDTPAKVAEGVSAEAVAFIRSRTIPAILSDVAIGLDESQRTATTPLEKVQSGIPKFREGLPEKTNPITGQSMDSEGLLSTVLFGSRVKTAEDSRLITEINRLYGENAAPAITDIGQTSERVKQLKEQKGELIFQTALREYGREFSKTATKTISTTAYRKLSDEEKQAELNKIRGAAVNDILDKYHYKEPKKRQE
jgi:hypothetical protein